MYCQSWREDMWYCRLMHLLKVHLYCASSACFMRTYLSVSWCLAEDYRNWDQRHPLDPCGSGRTLCFLLPVHMLRKPCLKARFVLQSANTRAYSTTILRPFSGATQVSRCQKTSGLCGAREDKQRQTHRRSSWAPLHPDQPVPTSTNPHFLQAGCPSCRPTNSVKHWKQLVPTIDKIYWLLQE